MENIVRVHNNHYIMETDTEVVSFNPNKTSIEDMLKGNYVGYFRPTYSLSKPERLNNGKMMYVATDF